MPVLGITGGIATGKTLLTGCLGKLLPGLRVFDSDRCARELTASDAGVLEAIRAQFGPLVFDENGVLQRAALRAIVFADPVKRAALEAILHPAIRRAWLDLARDTREPQAGNNWLAVNIPLLFETAAEKYFDHIIVVACSGPTQRRRLMENRQLDPGLAESMIAAQLPLEEKMGRAHFVVWNNGAAAALQLQAVLLAGHLLS